MIQDKTQLEDSIWQALKEVPDPELPAISVVDLNVIRAVRIDEQTETIHVDLVPTFAGCPALEQMRATITERLASLAREVKVHILFNEVWSTEGLSEEARQKLRRVGIAPPPRAGQQGKALPMLMRQPLICPYCGSQQTLLENSFGPAPCRAIAYCQSCHQPFEQFKPL